MVKEKDGKGNLNSRSGGICSDVFDSGEGRGVGDVSEVLCGGFVSG